MKIAVYTIISIAGLCAGIFYSATHAQPGPEADYFKRVNHTHKATK